jgi:hypothetical protein
MKWVLRVGGALAVLMGAVWMLQGIGVLPGSFMTGQMTWFWNGLVVAAIGAAGIVLSARRTGPG